jgi:hypothetical protein
MLSPKLLPAASEVDESASPVMPDTDDSRYIAGYESCCCDATHCGFMELAHGSKTDRSQSAIKWLIASQGTLTLTEGGQDQFVQC